MYKKPLAFAIISTLFILVTRGSFSALAQGFYQWSPQQNVPGYGDDTLPPVLIADQNRTVHAFTSQWVGSNSQQKAIIYNQWTLNQGWTAPVDILLSPYKIEARLLGAFLDQDDVFHIIFFGGDNTDANIYYSNAPAVHASRVQAWSNPRLVAKEALSPENGAILRDEKGDLIILFGGRQNGNGLYAIYSADNGESWSEPEPIFLTAHDELWPFEIKLYLSPSGEIYSVWSVYNNAGQGLAVYFAALDMGQRKWGEPHELATGIGLGVALPEIIEYDENLIITYYDSIPNAHFMISSNDNGQNWSEPFRIAQEIIGRNGAASLVIDSNNVLHIFFGGRKSGSPADIHGMWHATLSGDQMSSMEAVVSGPRKQEAGERGFDPASANAEISQGNILLISWLNDLGGEYYNGVWYSYSILNAPELPIVPLESQPIKQNVTTSQVADTVQHQPVNSSNPVLDEVDNLVTIPELSNTTNTTIKNPNTIIINGILPAVILILLITVYVLFRSKRF